MARLGLRSSFAALRRRVGGRRHVAAPAVSGPAEEQVQNCWEPGHHYSPVPDTRVLAREPARSRVWPAVPREMSGVDWRSDAQLELVRDRLLRQAPFELPGGPTGDPLDYHTGNDFFGRADAWALQAMLRELRPARVIEVGSGWSSLLTARVNHECLGGHADVICIEPYPVDFIAGGVPGISRLIAEPVEQVPLELFSELGDGDVLFIDTAHVTKTGGDVNFLFHEVLPRLATGVAVHIHDIFLPWDYPEEWVLGGRAWNEQYLVQAFLAFNDSFEVLLAVAWMCRSHPGLLARAMDGFDAARDGGGSLWLRRAR